MATTVGKLTIDLEAGTYQYTSALDKAGADAKRTANDIQGSFNNMNLGEARGSLMVLDETLGVHLPRHVTMLIAQLPMLGAALEAALPIFAVVAVAEAIGRLIEKHDQLAAAVRKAAAELANLDVKEKDRTETLQLQNIKLDDQIQKLEGRPSHNKLAEALLEAKIAADALASALTQDIAKGIEVLEEQSGGWEKFKDAVKTAFTTLKGDGEFETTYQGMKNVITTMEMVNDARTKLADSKTEAQTVDAVKGLQYAYGQLRSSAETALGWIQEHAPDNVKAIGALKGVILESAAGIRDMGLEQKHMAEEHTVANLEALHNRIDTLDKDWAQTKKTLDAETKETIAAYEVQKDQGQITADQLALLKQDALDRVFAATMAHYERVKNIEAGHPDLIKQINVEEQALIDAHNAQILDTFHKTLEEQKRGIDDLSKHNEEFYNYEVAADDKATAQILKNIDRANKARVADINMIQGLGDKRIAQIDHEIAELNRLIDQYHLQGDTAQNVYAKIHELEIQRQKDLDEDMLKSGKLGQVFKATFDQMISEGQQWQTKVGDTFKKTVDQMNNEFAKFIATGKMDWKSLGTSAVEEIVKIALQYLESHLLMLAMHGSWNAASAALDAEDQVTSTAVNVGKATSSAFTAAATTLADVPYPANIPASEEVLGLGLSYAADAFALQGGIVPREMLIHAHPEEMILPRNISNFVMNAVSDNGRSSSPPVQTEVHYHLESIDPTKAATVIQAAGAESARRTSKLMERNFRKRMGF